jgi:hypothetical protein
MPMSSIMRWRSGLILWLRSVVARLLSSNEADCLIAQHRKLSEFPMKNHHVETERIPRERLTLTALSRPIFLANSANAHRPQIVHFVRIHYSPLSVQYFDSARIYCIPSTRRTNQQDRCAAHEMKSLIRIGAHHEQDPYCIVVSRCFRRLCSTRVCQQRLWSGTVVQPAGRRTLFATRPKRANHCCRKCSEQSGCQRLRRRAEHDHAIR